MKTQTRSVLTLLFLAFGLISYAQKITPQQQEKQKRKVEVFTPDEKDNLQFFVEDQVIKMNLSDKLRGDYYALLLHYTYEMARLDDNDKDYTEDETKTKLKELTQTLNHKMQKLLNREQLKIHQEMFDDILRSVYNRRGWTKD